MPLMNVNVADADDFLVQIAVKAEFGVFKQVEAEPLFDNPNGVPAGLYQRSMAKFLESDRLLKVEYDETNHNRLLVRLSPNGVMRARNLARPQPKPSVVERLVSERSQKLVNLGNFLVALLALVVAAVALLRTN